MGGNIELRFRTRQGPGRIAAADPETLDPISNHTVNTDYSSVWSSRSLRSSDNPGSYPLVLTLDDLYVTGDVAVGDYA